MSDTPEMDKEIYEMKRENGAKPDLPVALNATKRCLGFLRSIALGGEEWTEQAQREYDKTCAIIDTALDSTAPEIIYRVSQRLEIERDEARAELAELRKDKARLSQGALDVLAERQRHVEVEGWTSAHDADHANGELAKTAACCALTATMQEGGEG